MSKTLRKLSVVITIILLLVLIPEGFAAGDSWQESPIAEPYNTQNGLTYTVSVPVDEFFMNEVLIDGQVFTRITLPGFSNSSVPGLPELPIDTKNIGVPMGAKVEIEVIPGSGHTIDLNAPIIPGVNEIVEWLGFENENNQQQLPTVIQSYDLDPSVYGSDLPYPGVSGEVVNDGIMRQQRIVSIAVYPIQYDPIKSQITIFDSMTVIVDFGHEISTVKSTKRIESDVYERLLSDTLLNYDSSKGWREEIAAEPIMQTSSMLDEDHTSLSPWTPPDPAWRISVEEEGFYQIPFSQLTGVGVPIGSIDLNTLQLFNQGEEVAIQVIPGDSIKFFGESIDSKYTAENVYWLTYGSSPGLRIELRDAAPGGATLQTSYEKKITAEVDQYYRSKIQMQVSGADDYERFAWKSIIRNESSITPFSYEFQLEDWVGGAINLKFPLIGYMDDAYVDPDHIAQVSVNGYPIIETSWDGYSSVLIDVGIAPEKLNAAVNTLEITAKNTGSSNDMFSVDWIEIEYDSLFQAVDNQIEFSSDSSGESRFEITGFDTNLLEVYDISDPLNVASLENTLIELEGGTYTLTFQDEITDLKGYWVGGADNLLSISSIEMDAVSSLQSLENQADYIMITHQEFWDEVEDLRDYRINQGLSTVLVDVQDIYDEFSYGIIDIYAIQAFLAYTYDNWVDPAPTYVLLVGDGHYDPKDHLGEGRESFIPPYLANVDPEIGETAADNRYVSLVGDDTLPDMILGRLSVNTSDEAQDAIVKIISYDDNPPEGDWRMHLLAVADNPDTVNYALLSDFLIEDEYPTEPYQVEKVYWEWTHDNLAEAQADILAGFNNGVLLVNYIGHGYYAGWAQEDLLTTSDIASLNTQDKLPIVVAMTCMEGYYISPYPYSDVREALGEVITRADGKGAVASWSPTGWGSTDGHDVINRGFFNAVFSQGVNTVGQVTQSSLMDLWATGDHLDLIDTYLLFGDPATKIAMVSPPVEPDYSIFIPLFILNNPDPIIN